MTLTIPDFLRRDRAAHPKETTMAPRTPSDSESLALSAIQRLLRPLTEAERARVLAFVNSKFAGPEGKKSVE